MATFELEVNAAANPVTMNVATGKYTAPAESVVQVRLSASGTDSGSTYLNVSTAPGNGGSFLGGVSATWNPGSVDMFSFVMPLSGEVWFYGRHSLGIGGSKSNASQVQIINGSNITNFSFNYDNPLQL